MPIRLPATVLLVTPAPNSVTPMLPLPEIRLPAPAAEPPIVLPLRRIAERDAAAGVADRALKPDASTPM